MIIACLALRFIATYHLLRGDPLERVEAETQRCRAFAQEKHYPVVIALNESTRQLVRKLRGVPPDNPTPETGPAETVARSAVAASTDRIPFVIVAEHLSAVTWNCIMGEYAAGYRELRHAEPLLWAIPGLLPNYDYFYYGSVCNAAICDTLGAEERQSAVRLLAGNLEQLRTWAENNPGTFSRSYLLVAAELARLEHRHVDAMRCYEQAIEAARAGRYVQDEALASERAACCHMELGLAASAEAHLRNAYDGYSRWGAAAKLRQMEANYPRIREYWAAGGATDHTNSPVQLDTLAITRAAQAISGQIVREKLLQTLLSIAVEQAGAQSAALLLLESGKLRLAATARVGVEEIVVLMLKDTQLDPPLPQSILSYVQHSREAVVLSDDLGKRTFASDPYLQQCPPASMLCMPILRQDALVGVLYLEHADIPQMFTRARLAVLEQLAAQAAISLENAELYGRLEEHSRTLEERVAARTEELRTTIQDLEAFSTTLSHDLQAPLRHISGFTDRLDKHCGATLDATAQHYLEIMRKSARRMDQMISKLLEFSRTSRARMEPTAVDLGELTRDVLESLQMDLQGRRVDWRIRELPRVTGDRTLLRSVLTNLIGNAIKYSRPRDPAVIEIGCATTGDGAGGAIDRVRARQRRGLRSQLCPQVVRGISTAARGGRVRRQRHRTGQCPAYHRAARWQSLGGGCGEQRRDLLFFLARGRRVMSGGPILLVEDDDIERELTLSALAEARLTNPVVIAQDGAEALDYLLRRGCHAGRGAADPILVLLDLRLPKVDGLEVLTAIRAIPSCARSRWSYRLPPTTSGIWRPAADSRSRPMSASRWTSTSCSPPSGNYGSAGCC